MQCSDDQWRYWSGAARSGKTGGEAGDDRVGDQRAGQGDRQAEGGRCRNLSPLHIGLEGCFGQRLVLVFQGYV